MSSGYVAAAHLAMESPDAADGFDARQRVRENRAVLDEARGCDRRLGIGCAEAGNLTRDVRGVPHLRAIDGARVGSPQRQDVE